MNDRPNILFLFADQLRATSLPVYGEDQIETPNIDRLAREGMTFTNSIASCPVCTPYRSMLLLGRHPQTTGHGHSPFAFAVEPAFRRHRHSYPLRISSYCRMVLLEVVSTLPN